VIRGILGDVTDTMPGTWLGHGLAAVGVYLAGAAVALVNGYFGAWSALGVALGLLALLLRTDRVWIFFWPLAPAFVILLGLLPTQGGALGAVAALGYYLHRERRDKYSKVKVGAYTEEARLDKVGDTLGPALVALTAVLAVVMATL